MIQFAPHKLRRRQPLRAFGGLAAGAFGATLARADDLPKNTDPRAISSDLLAPTATGPGTHVVP